MWIFLNLEIFANMIIKKKKKKTNMDSLEPYIKTTLSS